jgi:hypothetical protein
MADIFRAIRDRNIARVRELIEAVPAESRKAWLSQKSSGMQNTPLLAAVATGNMEIVRLIVDAGADLTARNASDNTVVHSAAQKGYTEILSLFLSLAEIAALIDEKNSGDHTALHLAAREGHRGAVDLLVEKRARIQLGDVDIARERGHDTIAEFLSQEFARPLRWANAPAPTSAADPDIFLLAGGHGGEEVGAHDIVPSGRTLVVMAKCGSMLVNADIFQKLAGVFTSSNSEEAEIRVKRLLLDVSKKAAGIEDFLDLPRGTLRIYSAGERCPRLAFMPVGIQRIPGIVAYSNSGVYKFPTEREHLFSDGDTMGSVVLSEAEPVDDELLDIMYTGSVYPTPAAAKSLFHAVDSNMSRFESLMVTPVHEIMDNLGAGVYFYAVCRSSMEPLNVEQFVLREYNRDPATFRPFVLDVPGRFAEIVERFNPPLAANTAGRIGAIMERRARSSSERLRRTQRGGLRLRHTRRLKRRGSSYRRSH